jgi:hypothetical protein
MPLRHLGRAMNHQIFLLFLKPGVSEEQGCNRLCDNANAVVRAGRPVAVCLASARCRATVDSPALTGPFPVPFTS